MGRLARLGRWGIILLACLTGAILAVNAFARVHFSGQGLAFTSGIRLLSSAETRLSIPPLGTVTANTHRAPVTVEVELRGVNPGGIQDLGNLGDEKERAQMLAEVGAQARRSLERAGLVALALAGAGSLVGALVCRIRAGRRLIIAFLAGSLGCLAFLGWTYAGFDLSALAQPRYEGMLESAPWVMSVLGDSLNGLDQLGSGFQAMAKNLPRLAQQGRDGTPMADLGEDLRVLHVSDLHSSSAALDLIKSIARNFAVDLIVDTGDLTDFGSPLESGFVDGLKDLGVPYLWVAGNHDSPVIRRALKKLPNIYVLAEGERTVCGLRFIGAPDPSSAGQEVAPRPDEARAVGERLLADWRDDRVKPDMVVGHQLAMIEPFIGLAPVILHGHDHQASLRIVRGTLIEDAGTTGAAGWRGLASTKEVPYTLSLQYWRKDSRGKQVLMAVDTITVAGLDGRVQVVRTMVEGKLVSQRQETATNQTDAA